MKTIWKYELRAAGEQIIVMPEHARILSVQSQNDAACLWAIVESTNRKVRRTFRIHGTGHPIDYHGDYPHVGTFQLHGGSLVFHVFDIGEVSENPSCFGASSEDTSEKCFTCNLTERCAAAAKE